MGFISKLFGGSRKNKTDKSPIETGRIEEHPSASAPESPSENKGTGTTLRQDDDVAPQTEKKSSPELTALDMAERGDWVVRTLPQWSPGDVIWYHYRIEGSLSGGLGRVYIATHLGWRRKLALKGSSPFIGGSAQEVHCLGGGGTILFGGGSTRRVGRDLQGLFRRGEYAGSFGRGHQHCGQPEQPRGVFL